MNITSWRSLIGLLPRLWTGAAPAAMRKGSLGRFSIPIGEPLTAPTHPAAGGTQPGDAGHSDEGAAGAKADSSGAARKEKTVSKLREWRKSVLASSGVPAPAKPGIDGATGPRASAAAADDLDKAQPHGPNLPSAVLEVQTAKSFDGVDLRSMRAVAESLGMVLDTPMSDALRLQLRRCPVPALLAVAEAVRRRAGPQQMRLPSGFRRARGACSMCTANARSGAGITGTRGCRQCEQSPSYSTTRHTPITQTACAPPPPMQVGVPRARTLLKPALLAETLARTTDLDERQLRALPELAAMALEVVPPDVGLRGVRAAVLARLASLRVEQLQRLLLDLGSQDRRQRNWLHGTSKMKRAELCLYACHVLRCMHAGDAAGGDASISSVLLWADVAAA